MPRKTTKEMEETRTRLLASALSVFCSKGVAATTLEDVATHAGLTRGAVYWHFQDKNALLSHLLNLRDFPLEQLVPSSSLRNDCAQLVTAVTRTACHAPYRQLMTILLQQSEWGQQQRVVRARIMRARGRLSTHLTHTLDLAWQRQELAQHWTPADIAVLRSTLQSSITGVLYESLLIPLSRRRSQIINNLQFMMRHMTSAPLSNA